MSPAPLLLPSRLTLLSQVIIFTTRHDLHNRAVYDAYLANKAERKRTETSGEAVHDRRSGSGRSVHVVGNGSTRRSDDADGSHSSSSSSAVEEKAVIAELVSSDGSAWRKRRIARGSAAGEATNIRDNLVDVVRHTERSHGAQGVGQPRRRLQQHMAEDVGTGEGEGGGEAQLDQQQWRQVRSRRPASSRRTRRQTMLLSSNDGEEEGHQEEPGSAGNRPIVLVTATSEEGKQDDTSRMAGEPKSPLPLSGFRPRGSRPRRVAEEEPEGKVSRDAPTTRPPLPRPQRRLLADSVLGPGPVAEGIEEISSSVPSSVNAGSTDGLLGRRRGGPSDDVAVAVEGLVSGNSSFSHRGSLARRLLPSSLEHNNSTVDGNGGDAAIELSSRHASGGDRRLYGGHRWNEKEDSSIPFYKRPYLSHVHGAGKEDTNPASKLGGGGGGGGARGSDSKVRSKFCTCSRNARGSVCSLDGTCEGEACDAVTKLRSTLCPGLLQSRPPWASIGLSNAVIRIRRAFCG